MRRSLREEGISTENVNVVNPRSPDLIFPSTEVSPATTDTSANNNVLQMGDLHLEGRDAIALLERAKLVAPILLLFLIKLVMEHIVLFIGTLVCSFSLYQTKSRFHQLLSLKLFQIKTILLLLILSFIQLIALYSLITYCGLAEPLWQRIFLFSSTDPDLSFLNIIWKCFITDMYAQLLVLALQILCCYMYLLHFFQCRHANETSSSIHHSSRSSTDLEAPRLCHGNSLRGISSASSDIEAKYTSEIYLAQKRICLLVSIFGLIYRSLLPVRIFFVFRRYH